MDKRLLKVKNYCQDNRISMRNVHSTEHLVKTNSGKGKEPEILGGLAVSNLKNNSRLSHRGRMRG